MEESAQQAINIGVNVTIFVIALSISLNLMFSVRDLSEVAKTVQKNVPDGSKTEMLQHYDNRIISGQEVVSYYINYIKPYFSEDTGDVYNHPDMRIEIDRDGNGSIDYVQGSDDTVGDFIHTIDFSKNYKLSINKYYEDTGVTKVLIERVN